MVDVMAHFTSAGGLLSPTQKPAQAALVSVTPFAARLGLGAKQALSPIISVVPVSQLAGTFGGFLGRTHSAVSPRYATELALTSHTRARASVQSTNNSCDFFPVPSVPGT